MSPSRDQAMLNYTHPSLYTHGVFITLSSVETNCVHNYFDKCNIFKVHSEYDHIFIHRLLPSLFEKFRFTYLKILYCF